MPGFVSASTTCPGKIFHILSTQSPLSLLLLSLKRLGILSPRNQGHMFGHNIGRDQGRGGEAKCTCKKKCIYGFLHWMLGGGYFCITLQRLAESSLIIVLNSQVACNFLQLKERPKAISVIWVIRFFFNWPQLCHVNEATCIKQIVKCLCEVQKRYIIYESP